ncbi:MAG: hypothetical protein DMG38_14075 [Acidobacteria bacterium]|nr:MAG: hypothetical protein DMG38_14075 [Acidobacteriota bacterium]
MPDWRGLVRQRLSGPGLDAAERDEVHAELAAHLEESYEGFCKEGLPEREAVHRTFEQVGGWEDLRRKISAAKRRELPVKKRVQQLWIPGFLTLVLSMTFLAMLQELGFRPRIVWSGTSPIFFYVLWLASLPFFGAMGAYFSARAGASRASALLASIFPVPALTAAFLLMFPIGMIIERVTGNHVDFSFVATVLLKDGISCLLVPGAALFVGGVLADILFGRRPWSQDAAIG